MATFLLLHGAWHGGWCWTAVAERLTTAGHRVEAPDLPGLGEDAANLSPDIGLENHLACAQAVLEDLQGAVVCGHSYGGVLARGLLDRCPDLVDGLVLIEALWPDDGQAALDCIAPAARTLFVQRTKDEGDGWRLPPPDPAQFALADPALHASIAARMTDHPFRTFQDPLRLTGPARFPETRRYLIATDRDPQPYAETAAALAAEGWTLVEHPGGHEMMVTQPQLVANLLLESATAGAQSQTPAAAPSRGPQP